MCMAYAHTGTKSEPIVLLTGQVERYRQGSVHLHVRWCLRAPTCPNANEIHEPRVTYKKGSVCTIIYRDNWEKKQKMRCRDLIHQSYLTKC